MNRTKVVSHKNLPTKLPIGCTVVTWLLLDRLHVAGWIWWEMAILMALYWVICIIAICVQDSKEIL